MVSKRTVLLLLHDSILGICTGSSVVSFVCELNMNEVHCILWDKSHFLGQKVGHGIMSHDENSSLDAR